MLTPSSRGMNSETHHDNVIPCTLVVQHKALQTMFRFLILLVAVSPMTFEEWRGTKRYSSLQEYILRKQIYEANLERWKTLNRIEGGAKYGPEGEAYADRTAHEFAEILRSCSGLTTRSSSKKPSSNPFTVMYVDWRKHPPPAFANTTTSDDISYVTPVKNQGAHGTCWSFGAAENLEGLAVRQGFPLQNISEQEFISCCETCRGASTEHSFAWLKETTDGIPALEETYPYDGRDSIPCRVRDAPKARVQLHSWGRVVDEDGTGDAIQTTLEAYGPLGVGVDATCFHGYQYGIIRECQSSGINHAVLLVASGTDLFYNSSYPISVDFFTIKNSWGPRWGEDGYVRIERGKDWWGKLNVIYTE